MEAHIIALVFDYDDTLVPDSTTFLFNQKGINARDFWDTEFSKLISLKYDSPLAYLKLILDKIKPGKPLESLSNNELRKIGGEVEKTLYPGLPSLISDLNETMTVYNKKGLMFKIEYYVISGGLEEIIKGNKYIIDNFTGIYGCRLGNDCEDDSKPLTNIKRTINFTEKTRYLFEINKGISNEESDKDPASVNKFVEEKERRIPFSNMIYVGDGLTDIPCFSLLNKNGGICFSVYHHKDNLSERLKAFEQITKAHRTYESAPPNYNEDQQMGSRIRTAVESICINRILEKDAAK